MWARLLTFSPVCCQVNWFKMNVERWKSTLNDFLWPELNRLDVSDVYFRQNDDGMCHTNWENIQFLAVKKISTCDWRQKWRIHCRRRFKTFVFFFFSSFSLEEFWKNSRTLVTINHRVAISCWKVQVAWMSFSHWRV